jgi:hypothetical protein
VATDLTLHLVDHPGELARVGELLGKAGVNIDGFCAVTSGGGRAEVHVLVDDLANAFRALEEAGVHVASEQEVAIVDVEDRPGVLGEISRKLGDAGVNITLAYLATRTRLVLAADDFVRAREALATIQR